MAPNKQLARSANKGWPCLRCGLVSGRFCTHLHSQFLLSTAKETQTRQQRNSRGEQNHRRRLRHARRRIDRRRVHRWRIVGRRLAVGPIRRFCRSNVVFGTYVAARVLYVGPADEVGGRRGVPDDIAVVGYDNWNPMVLGVDPPLTSVDMCLENVGRAAAEHLLSALNGEPTHGVHTVPCELVVRGSTVAEPAARG